MSFIRLPYRYQMRGFTAAECASKNEVLLAREWCEETDTGRCKQGDGETPWNDLPYATPGFIDISALADGYALTWDATAGMLVFAPAGSPASTDAVPEGSTNKYFTDERAQDAVAAALAAGTHTNVTVTYDDAGNKISLAAASGTGVIDPRTTASKRDDFEDWSTSGWTTQVSGGSVGLLSTTATAGRPGIVQLNTSGSATGVSSILDSTYKWLVLGGGAFSLTFGFDLPVLSNGTNRYATIIGLRDNAFGTSTDELTLVYSDNLNSGNWIIRGTVGGVTTEVNAASGPSAAAWYCLRIDVNAAGTSAEFFINGTSIGTTTAVPTVPLRRAARIGKSVGTTQMLMYVDYSSYTYTFTTPR